MQFPPAKSNAANRHYLTLQPSILKEFKEKKPHSTTSLTEQGRAAFREYKNSLPQVLDDLPE
jgi:hypothetical protein